MSQPHDADTPDTRNDLGQSPADESTGSDAAPKRRRNRRKPADRSSGGESDSGVGGTSEAAVPAPPAQGQCGEPGAESDTDAGIAANGPSSDAGGDGPSRRSRRNRRRGRKGRTPREDGGMGGDLPAQGPNRPNHMPIPDAGDLFASVTSGSFDSESSPAESIPADSPVDVASDADHSQDAVAAAVDGAAGDVFEPAAAQDPGRRVLAPDAEAPKLQKVLAQAGVGSRRDLEQMIIDKRVTVNEEVAHTGQRVSWGDRVAVDGKPVRVRIAPLPARVIAYHKPAGEVVSHDDPQQRPTVFRRLPRLAHGKWQSVGRLDINTEGLLLFTTSGEMANQLMHPRFGVEREYAVRVLGTLESEARARLLEGIEIDGHPAAFKSIEDGGGEGVNHWYRVVITEGRNREVRNLFDAVGLTVSRLIRIRYGSVVLPRGLRRGVWVDLADDDVKLLRRLTGVGGHGGQGDGSARAGSKRGRGGRDDAGLRAQAEPRQGGPRQGPRDDPPRRERQPPAERGPRGDRVSHANRVHGKQRQQAGFGDAAVHAQESHEDDHIDDVDVRNIPNPLQQTFDQRAIREARSARRELGDDAPIPNPLQQTYDKRALKEGRDQGRDPGRDSGADDDGPIPNPLQQTYDKRFAGGGGGSSGRGGRGRPGGGGGGRRKGAGKPAAGQPDPMKTAVGYIGGDAFLRKKSGGRGGKGGGGGRGRGGQGGKGR